MTIRWDESLRFGEPAIDKQHEEIFVHFNKLTCAIENGDGNAVIIDLLTCLNDYASIHFAYEEKMMEYHKYSGLEEQRKQHSIFKENITIIADMQKINPSSYESPMRLLSELIRYCILHVQKLDKEFACYIKAESIK